jgi:hypothetical protein
MHIVCLSNNELMSLMAHKDSHNATLLCFENMLGINIQEFVWLGDKSFLVF